MSTWAPRLVLGRPRAGARVGRRAGSVLAWPHLPGLGAQVLLGLWLCRAFAGSGLPAGTDSLGFVARAAANARGGTWLSAWSPDSLGAPRQITLESALGLITRLTGDPVVTVKLFMLLTLVASGAGAYWLTWRWYRTRLGAGVAGLLYMGGQLSLAQTASGHLNVCVVLALAPVVLVLAVEGIEEFSLSRALWLGLALAALVLARPDMALYVVPFAALYVLVRGLAERRLRVSLRNGALTAGIALGAALALSLYEVLPALGGIRAAWGGGGLFTLDEFNHRSVSALPSLLGFGREIGYLAFTGRQTWTSHPWLSFAAYVALALIPVAAAWATLAWRRDARTLHLLACAVGAAFLAKGLHGPVGGPYRWAAEHLPLFGDLRDPNRWLIVGWLAVAVLAGVAAARVPELLARVEATRPARAIAVTMLVGAVALPNAPTLLAGLQTWRPTLGQAALLRAARAGDGPLATVPFDQTRRFLVAGAYRGWEHDLGADSSLWTGRPALADGGWSRPTADTVAYATTLLARRDPALPRLLAALGVSDALAFRYRPTAPHLVGPRDPYYQQHALAALPGVQPVRETGAGGLVRIDGAAPLISARPRRAVVLGGRAGLAALARLPGVTPAQWAAQDAASLVQAGGAAALIAAMRGADLVVMADATPGEVALLATPALAALPGISSDPDLARETQTVPPDLATRLGSLASDTAPPARAGARESSVAFAVPSHGGAVELWARVRGVPDAARLAFAVDGRPAGAVVPLAPAAAGLSWVRVAARGLAPGRHRLTVRASTSPYGSSYELDEARVVAAARRQRVDGELAAALRAATPRTAWSYDLADAVRTVRDPALFRAGSPLAPAAGFWQPLEHRTRVAAAGATAVSAVIAAGRDYHAVLAHAFAAPQDWGDRAYLFLRVRGTGDGAAYRLVLDADPRHVRTAELAWRDDRPGWRLLAFPLLRAGAVARHVVSVRLAADDRARGGRLLLGAPALSAPRSDLTVDLPLPAGAARRATVDGGVSLAPAVGGVRARIPLADLGRHLDVVAAPAAGVPAARPVGIRWKRTGTNAWSFHVVARQPVTLVLGRAADPHWRAAVDGRRLTPERSWGALAAWRLEPGVHDGTIAFAGDRLVALGAAGSAGALAALAGLLLLARRRGAGAPLTASGPAPSPTTWRPAWLAPLAPLAALPLAYRAGGIAVADALAVVALAAMALALLLAIAHRRRCAEPPR